MRCSWRAAVCVPFALCVHCAGPQSHTNAPATSRAPSTTVAAPLVYELAGRAFPSPLLRVQIGGRSTWLIVDTGATNHVLSRWLAEELHLGAVVDADASGIEHGGRAISVARADHVTLRAGDWTMLDDASIAVVDVPEVLHTLDIGGFLSPQSLAVPGRSIVLDLQHGEIALAPDADARARAAAQPHDLAPTGTRLCGHPGESADRKFVVPVSLDGVDAALEIDTGAGPFDVANTSAAGTHLAQRVDGSDAGTTLGAAGAYETRRVHGVHVRVGEVEQVVDVDLGPNASRPSCTLDGVIGMSLLRRCVLVFDMNGASGRCGD